MAGEGKSTVAIDLAEQLAREKHRVMLIDFDLRGQNDARLLGMKGGVTVADVLRKPKLLDENFLRFSKRLGFFLLGWGTKGAESLPLPAGPPFEGHPSAALLPGGLFDSRYAALRHFFQTLPS